MSIKPIAVNRPFIIDEGIWLAKAPAFKNPASNCNAPANKTANKNNSNENLFG